MMNYFQKPLFTLLTIGLLATACEGTDTDAVVPATTPPVATPGTVATDQAIEVPAPVVEAPVEAPTDADGDGFDSAVDCADDNPAVHPGVEENTFTNNGGRHANLIDDNCDLVVDEPGLCDCDDLKGYAIPGGKEKTEAKQGHGAKRFSKMCMNRLEEFKAMPGFDCVETPKGKKPKRHNDHGKGEGNDVDDNDGDDDESEAEQKDFISAFKFHYKLINKNNSDLESRWSAVTTRIDFKKGDQSKYLECKISDMAVRGDTQNTQTATEDAVSEIATVFGIKTTSASNGAAFDVYFNTNYSFEKCKGTFTNLAEYRDYAVQENVTGFSLSLDDKPTVNMGIKHLTMSVAYDSAKSKFIPTYNNPYVMAYLNDNFILSPNNNTQFPNTNEVCAAPNVLSGFAKNGESSSTNLFDLFTWPDGMSNQADGTGSKNAIRYYVVTPKLVFTRDDMAVSVSATGAMPLISLNGVPFFDELQIQSTEQNFRWNFTEDDTCQNKNKVTVFDGLKSNQVRKAMYYTSAISEAEILGGGSLSLGYCNDPSAPCLNINPTMSVNLTNITVTGVKVWADDITGKFKHYKLTKTGTTTLGSDGVSLSEDDGKATEYDTVKTDF